MSTPSIRGISYPLTIVNGNLGVSTDYDLKSQEIRSVIETRFFERVMAADYGVSDRTLDVLDPSLINSDFQNAISKFVLGLTSLSIDGDWVTNGDDGLYRVFISFAVDGVPQPPVNFSLSL